jgi:hypothetical protein
LHRAGNRKCRFAGLLAGATGLEPATSGVTGNFQDRDMHHDWLWIAHFMRILGSGSSSGRMVDRTISNVCCPFAARLLPARATGGRTLKTTSPELTEADGLE